MSSTQRQLNLNLFIYPGGHHEASWRYKDTDPTKLLDVATYRDLAQRAEAAKFDAVFFADSPALPANVRYAARYRTEPLTLLTAIAGATERIGLIGTASTSYYEPYNLARLYASLDHISGGRAGWNIVTTSLAQAAANFGLNEPAAYSERYGRAAEFVDVVTKLWDSWEDDALVTDQASGLFADDTKIHAIDHVSASRARSARRAVRRGVRSISRQARRMTVARSPLVMPRRSSPPTRRSKVPGASTPTSSIRQPGSGATLITLRSCPASAPSSGPRRRRPRLSMMNSTI
jgi:alkanesulfonate monooxygenase SsuD/methylene tetrahydromethanopterin reductase-like flavin-dependent oxidoreductase (luciferase family)